MFTEPNHCFASLKSEFTSYKIKPPAVNIGKDLHLPLFPNHIQGGPGQPGKLRGAPPESVRLQEKEALCRTPTEAWARVSDRFKILFCQCSFWWRHNCADLPSGASRATYRGPHEPSRCGSLSRYIKSVSAQFLYSVLSHDENINVLNN